MEPMGSEVSVEAVFEPAAVSSSSAQRGELFDEIDTSDTPQTDFEDVGLVGEEASSPGGGATMSIDDALIEKVAQRVVDKLSQKVIQEIAWEVVPDLAEGLILKEIAALKAKIPKLT